MLLMIIFIISLVPAVMLANAAQQLYMRIMGASGMFFSASKKATAIILIALMFTGIAKGISGI